MRKNQNNSFYRIIVFSIIFSFSFACSDEKLDEINTNPNAPTAVPLNLLLPAAEIGVVNELMGNYGMFGVSNFTEHTSNVRLTIITPSGATGLWGKSYQALSDLKIIIDKGTTDEDWVFVGIGKVLYALTLSICSDMFGDIPHKEALLGSVNRSPKFDSQEEIYEDIQNLLDEAIADFSKPPLSNPDEVDLIFEGKANMWVKTAWALKARYYNRLSKRDPTGSASNALIAISNSFNSADEGCKFDKYLEGTSNDHPFGAQQKSQDLFGASETMIATINSFNDSGYIDPRADLWFTRNQNGEIIGAPAINDSDVSHTLYSAPSLNTIFANTAPMWVISYDELMFIAAESHLRKASPDASAAYTAYQAGVIAACERAGISSDDIFAYTSQGTVFSGSDKLTLEDIIKQKFISFFVSLSYEAFNDWRRTGIPTMMTSDANGTPLRLPYPQSEIDRNPNAPSNINSNTIYSIPIWWAED